METEISGDGILRIQVSRRKLVSIRSFEDVVSSVTEALGRPDSSTVSVAIEQAATVSDLEGVVREAVGASGLIEFARYDIGRVLQKDREGPPAKALRLMVGNPLIMREIIRAVPDAASYAPLTILIDDRSGGVHLSYDLLESLLVPYGSHAALAAARALDVRVTNLLAAAVRA